MFKEKINNASAEKTILAIPVLKEDKERILKQAQLVRLSIAGFCRFIILKNLKESCDGTETRN